MKPFRCILTIVTVMVCICSCSEGGKVIPRSKLAKIYADMFVVDAWLTTAPYENRMAADSTSVYEPIFNSYGYTTEDYLASVSHYLMDPDRFSRILKKSSHILDTDIEDIQKELDGLVEREQLRRKYRSSIRCTFTLYDTLFDKASFTDKVEIVRDPAGRYLPVRVVEDTSFFGPKLVLKSDTVEVKADVILETPRERARNRALEELPL